MADRVFGLEFEVAFAAFGASGERVEQSRALDRFMKLAAATLPHLPSRGGSGIFLQNGARLYVDCCKPEITTPEVLTPTDACRYARAADAILVDLAQLLTAQNQGIRQVVLSRCNVSYGPRATTWGCHESYGHQAAGSGLAAQLIPHLVSRIIYTGAGGFDNKSRGLHFLISPRVPHLTESISSESQRRRGIFHTKDESLSRSGFHRLHLLTGENVCSETSLWLKIGTTALVVALIEAGKRPGQTVQLRHPLPAMRAFSRDPSLTATAETVAGRRLSALDIQRRYLEQAERYQDAPFMPSWAGQVCQAWRAILDRLQQGIDAVATTLDWAIKLRVFQQYASRQGVSWQSLQCYNKALERLDEVSEKARSDHDRPAHIRQELLQGRGPAASHLRRLMPWLADQGLSAGRLEAVLVLREQLFELDVRFGQLGERGIFACMDRSGVLNHHVPGVEDIERAKRNPPDRGRAHLRGRCVRRFAGRNGSYACGWSGVWDFRRNRFLDLSDPLATEEVWRESPSAELSLEELLSHADFWRRRESLFLRRALDAAKRMYDRGKYEAAHERLSAVYESLPTGAADVRRDWFRYMAWVQARRGFLDGAGWLNHIRRDQEDPLGAICDYVCVHRFEGLVPSAAIGGWLRRANRLLARDSSRRPATVAALLGHQGYKLLCDGRPEEALTTLHEACRPDRLEQASPRVRARLLAEQAEAHRRLGHRAEAASLLDRAERIQTDHQLDGDLADFTLARRAKLLADQEPAAARELLKKARKIQMRAGNLMGEARTLLLLARLPKNPRFTLHRRWLASTRRRIEQIKGQRPALSHCPLLATILQQWDLWTGGDLPEGQTDDFWRL